MKKEDLSPEQLEAFTACMAESRYNIRHIVVVNMLLLMTLLVVNTFLSKGFNTSEGFLFFIQFMTTILILSSTKGELVIEADRFQEESQKILDNKL